jgi:CDP-diacylglycerol--glycerol-3-phosphate 3-phosphatidyltransferase
VTLANRITLLRLALIPPFCALVFAYQPGQESLRLAALALYLTAALTDGLDGYVARRWNQRSVLGTRLDPMTDKLLVNLGFVFLAANGGFEHAIPRWFPVFVLTRDVSIVLVAYAIHRSRGAVEVRPSFLGKLTTAAQFGTMVSVLAQWPVVAPLMWTTVVLTLVSGLGYVRPALAQAGFLEKT